MTWAHKRQLLYGSIALIGAIIILGIPLFLIFYQKPICSDGLKNGSETGVDCGGICTRLCPADALLPIIHFARGQEAVKGVWNTLAYVENPNVSSGALEVPYVFKLYDAEGIFIAERRGVTTIPPRSRIAIFESGISVKERVVDRVFFEFTEELSWKKMAPLPIPFELSFDPLRNADTSPQLFIRIKNTTQDDVAGFPIVALLYDAEGNLTAFSRTIVDPLGPEQSAEVIMSWPKAFSAPISRVELIPIR